MTTTYTYQCRCGQKSPGFDTKQKSRDWLASHHRREGCASRSSVRRLFADAELAELRAQAKRLKPIPVPQPVPRSGWQDSARSDPWGAPPQGPQVLKATWRGGNCVKACVASILNAPIERIPDPTVEYNEGITGWFDRYDARLQKATGYRLERLPLSCCPPKNANQIWIAGIHMPDHDEDHVVCARGYYVVFDPLGEFMGSLPWHRVIDGMVIRPTRRIVPVVRGFVAA
jgi:hypothetical protein